YCEEWWSQELKENLAEFSSENGENLSKKLEQRLNDFFSRPQNCIPTPDEAIKLSRLFSIPLHPEYTYHWSDISTTDYVILREYIFNKKIIQNDELIIPISENIKYFLECICIPHKVKDGKIHFEKHSLPFLLCLGIKNNSLVPIKETKDKVIDIINELSDIKIRDKCPVYTGARMGRPEKAKDRRMKPPVHMLFPIGEAGGRLRKLLSAAEEKQIDIELVRRRCPNCGAITHKLLCEKCSPPVPTIQIKYCPNCNKESKGDDCSDCGGHTVDYSLTTYPLGKEISNIRKKLGSTFPSTIKAVKKLMNKKRVPELLDKGILRSKHGVYVYRDGTVRFDATDAVLTHFKPSEIGITIQKLRDIGYTIDINGNILESPDQLVEMKIQDIILNIEGGKHLVRTANFIDELLEKVYGLPKYYKAKEPSDLIGHIIIGLAPHTSAGIVGRLIGFTQAKVNFAYQ
ncbi:MAG: DNA polymerase II large subunit, partial [Candidatus Heimdallarchaeaceae archaeon]